MPGGSLGMSPVGPSWSWGPRVGPDGLLVPPEYLLHNYHPSYPAATVGPPETIELVELLPIATYGRPFNVLSILEPDKYKLPYRIEAMINCRTNLIMTSRLEPE